MSKQLKKQLKKQVSIKETEKIEIPKYVLEGNQNIPEDLKKVLDYFRDCGNKNYSVSLIGTQGSPGAIKAEKELKERGGNPEVTYIHLSNENLNSLYSFLPVSVKNSIIRINRLISNPENDFNTTNLGIHTLGLIYNPSIPTLNALGYGLTSWNGVGVFSNFQVKRRVASPKNPIPPQKKD
jgi:hypothetical protein